MMAKPRNLRFLSGLLFGVGVVALIDGYGEFATGEEGIVRLLLIPVSMFLLSFAVFQRARKQIGVSEADDA